MLPCGSPGNKAAEFHYLDVAGDSHILKHGLYSLAYLYTCLVVIYPDAGLESVWISGLGQKGFCLLRVILISARAEVSEYGRCNDGVSRLSGAAGNGVDNQLAVNGVVNDIPYLDVYKRQLCLRLFHALQPGVETFLGIDTDEVQVIRTFWSKYSLYLVSLILTQQTVVHEHAGKLFANGLGQHDGSHRGIHTAGQSAQPVSYTHLDVYKRQPLQFFVHK